MFFSVEGNISLAWGSPVHSSYLGKMLGSQFSPQSQVPSALPHATPFPNADCSGTAL